MKICCSVEVLNRALPSLNMANKKAKKSVLTIGKLSGEDHFICHQTNENVSGITYKVKNNIQNVFCKFVDEGKATISFKEPNHNLAIRCDPIQLKGFLRTLKLCLSGIPSAHLSSIHSINVNKSFMKPLKTKLKLTKEEYFRGLGSSEGFPRSLETLIINAEIKEFDRRILRLVLLKVLNLEDNNLTTLPEVLGTALPYLAELYLGNNKLGESQDWRWIVNKNFSKNLKLLDLSSNNISFLPDRLVKLETLVTLKVNDNHLETLPNGIGFMKNLRYFYANDNDIRFVPVSLMSIQLEEIDLSTNAFFSNSMLFKRQILTVHDFQQVSPLLDIATRNLIKRKIRYSAETTPQTLIEYIESTLFCACGKPGFSPQTERFLPQLCMTVPTVIQSISSDVVFVLVRFCSYRCYSKMSGPDQSCFVYQ